MNKAIVAGHVSSYGPKISWTESGKAQTSFTLVLEKAGYKTFVPCLCVGTKAEEVAETMTGGDFVLVDGSLSWKAGRTKEAGRLQIVCFEVERVAILAQDERTETGEGDSTSTGEIVEPEPDERVPAPKSRRPRPSTWPGKKSALQESPN